MWHVIVTPSRTSAGQSSPGTKNNSLPKRAILHYRNGVVQGMVFSWGVTGNLPLALSHNGSPAENQTASQAQTRVGENISQ
ncbi:hypothetical protein TNCV_1841601 [Trichonephila clavipes]|nr:hypothetical protein TNCV_1841601 [Trichonephila clavipes]